MAQVQVSKEIMNKMVMNFLIVEGNKRAVLNFEKETGIKGKRKGARFKRAK